MHTHTQVLQRGRNVKENAEQNKNAPNSLIFHHSFSGMLFILSEFQNIFYTLGSRAIS